MVETVEIEVTATVAKMLERLRDHHGDLNVDADLERTVTNSISQGHQQLPEEA